MVYLFNFLGFSPTELSLHTVPLPYDVNKGQACLSNLVVLAAMHSCNPPFIPVDFSRLFLVAVGGNVLVGTGGSLVQRCRLART